MADLVVAVAAVALPWIGISLGAPGSLVAPVAIAGVLIWPGYVIARWLWPDESHLEMSQRLAFMPVLSIVATVIVALLAWATVQQATPGIVNMLTSIGMVVVIALIVLAGPSARRTREQTLREFGSALAIFVVLSTLIGFFVAVPADRAEMTTLALYLDPAGAIERTANADQIDIPLLIATPAHSARGQATGSASTTAFSLTAEAAGQVVAERRLELRPGERLRVVLGVPASGLSMAATPVDIRLRAVDSSATPVRSLRVWLTADR